MEGTILISDVVYRKFESFSMHLGPGKDLLYKFNSKIGLIGNAYDSLGNRIDGKDETQWFFQPLNFQVQALHFLLMKKVGDRINSLESFGKVVERGLIHYITFPPLLSGVIDFIASPNYYGRNDTVLEVTDNTGARKKFTLFQKVNVQGVYNPPPSQTNQPPYLFTGIRVIDALFPVRLGSNTAITGPNGSGNASITRIHCE